MAGDIAKRLAPAAATLNIKMLGPAPAPLVRLRGEHRAQLFLKGTRRAEMRNALSAVLAEMPEVRRRVTVDVDPLNVLVGRGRTRGSAMRHADPADHGSSRDSIGVGVKQSDEHEEREDGEPERSRIQRHVFVRTRADDVARTRQSITIVTTVQTIHDVETNTASADETAATATSVITVLRRPNTA